MQALVINSRNDIIATVNVAENVREIEIAGAVTIEGAPVNRSTYKLSRSKANFKRAERMELDSLTRREHKGFEFYTA